MRSSRPPAPILEEDGLDAVVMSRVAERVGVRGPSLYKHVRDRAALIRAVADGVDRRPGAQALAVAASTGEPTGRPHGHGQAYRAFVRANPNGYGLLFAHLGPGAPARPGHVSPTSPSRSSAATERSSGRSARSPAARTFVAWAHGFVTMELAGAFRLGGDLDAAYADGIESILAGVSGRGRPAARSRRTG